MLSRRRFATREQARVEGMVFIDWYNTVRRHSSNQMLNPVSLETAADAAAAATTGAVKEVA